MNAGDAWRPWPKASPAQIAHFVNVDAVKAALTSGALRSEEGGKTLHDLRRQGNLSGAVRAIYELLCKCNITYDLEPVLLDDPGNDFQRIRPPHEVIGGSGTCIDLALLFAGACIEARLLPCIVLLYNSAGAQMHALVAVDTKNTHDDWNKPRGWAQAETNRGWIERDAGTTLWRQEPPGRLWQQVLDGNCVLVECIGFASTTADERTTATLSFNAAQHRAARNLGAMDHWATIDIVRLQKGQGYSRYDPHRGVATGLHEIVTHHYPTLADYCYDSGFRTLIAQETRQLVGRSWVAPQLTEFRDGCTSGYFCFVADAGLGKTAIAARIAQDQQAPAFFFSAAEGRTDLESCLRHLSVDLILRFTLPHDRLPPRVDWAFLTRLFKEAVRKSRRLLIVIDGIDEAEPADGNTLFLPSRLPAGVHIVLSSRLRPVINVSGDTQVRHECLTPNDPRQMRDVNDFLTWQFNQPGFLACLRLRNLRASNFLERLREASDGNFMYLTYVLNDVLHQPAEGGYLRADHLPIGLTNYYELFWRSMERTKEKDTEGWRAWDELYRPTIAVLTAAAEPVTASWLSSIIAKSSEEITERALTPWKRFLRHHAASGRWWIVHKSFADFLIGGNRLDIRKTHRQIANHYMKLWGGVEGKWGQLPPTAAIDERNLYGARHISHHFRYGGNHELLQGIIYDPHWYSWRLAMDPSGDRFHFDALEALAASQEQTRNEIANGRPATGIAGEVRCLLVLATSNSLSSNLPDALPAALVQCAHWQPDIALRAIRLSPEPTQRSGALAALAPLLDEPHISAALDQARGQGAVLNQALTQVLRRLCILGQGERVLAEVERLSENSQHSILSDLADVLSERELGIAIDLVGAHYRRMPENTWNRGVIETLKALLKHAPASRLPSVLQIPKIGNDESIPLNRAVSLRWGKLQQFDRCEAYLEKMDIESRVITIALLVPLVPASQPALRAKYVARSLPHLSTLAVDLRVPAIVALAEYIEPLQLCALAREVLTREMHNCISPARIFRMLSPVLPADLLKEAADIAARLHDEYYRAEAHISLALRAAALNRPGEAVDLARAAGSSYYKGEAFVEVLPRLAEMGHADIAVHFAEKIEKYCPDAFVPKTLIAISRHVAGRRLDQMRDRAKLIKNAVHRRTALLGIAARYALLNNPAEALTLARPIDDTESYWLARAGIALSWLSKIRQPGRAIAEAWKLPAEWAWQTIAAMAGELSADTLRSLLAHSLSAPDNRPQETEGYHARLDAVASLLERLAASGFAAEAIAFAQMEEKTDRYLLVAVVAPYLDEMARILILESAIEDLLGMDKRDYEVSCVLRRLTAKLNESSLRKFESTLLRRRDSFEISKTIALRYAELSCLQDALRVARGDHQISELYLSILPQLGADIVHDLLKRLEMFGSNRTDAIRKLHARLGELGESDDAMQRIEALPLELRFAAIAGASAHAPREMLERLMSLVFCNGTDISSGEPEDGAAEAAAAIAARYGELGEYDRALEMLQQISWNDDAISKALVCMADGLSGHALEKAIEIAMRLESKSSPDPQMRALRTLLPILARHDCPRAIQIAARVSVTSSRRVALGSVTHSTAMATATDCHKSWTDAVQITLQRARKEVFHDLEVLMPLIADLGGATALEETAMAMEQIIQLWP